MTWLPRPETSAAVLKHPFFLAGVAVVALLSLTAATLVVTDSVRGGSKAGMPKVVVSAETGTAGPNRGTATTSGISGTTKGTTAVRAAPGTRTTILGTLSKKSDVQIDGATTTQLLLTTVRRWN